MSLFGAGFFRGIKQRFGPDAEIQFVERGYLILGGPGSVAARLAGVALQNAEGADIAALTPAEAKARFADLAVEDLGIATFGLCNEGWFDAWSLLSVVRDAARRRGVTYLDAHAEGIVIAHGRVSGVRFAGGETIAADWCVDAAGPAAAALVRDLGIALPVEPRKRTVFALKAPLAGHSFPMLFDTSGAWIRPEGYGFICGIAPPADRDPDATGDFEPDHDLFEEAVWPALAHRVPALEELRLVRTWAGHYEVNTLDHNGIVGPHDEIPNLVFAAGFSGHGVMHAPATGRAVAEWIVHGAYRTLDLSPLGYARIRAGVPLHETVIY